MKFGSDPDLSSQTWMTERSSTSGARLTNNFDEFVCEVGLAGSWRFWSGTGESS